MNPERLLADRVTELEVKLCDAEDTIDALNHHIFRQQEQLDLLQRQLTHLARQMQEASNAEGTQGRDLREEVPPHY